MKTVLLFDGSQIEPRLHRAIIPAEIRISRIGCLATTIPGEKRVGAFAHLLGCDEPERLTSAAEISNLFEREKPDRVILTLSEKTKLLTCLKSALSAGCHVCIGQPNIGFNTLDFADLCELYALAASTNGRLVAMSRFCFTPSIHQIQNLLEDVDFGGVNDLLFRTGWGPSVGKWDAQFTYLASHACHVVFSLLGDHGLPDQMTVLEVFRPKIKPPSFSISLQWKQGVIATLFLTSSRMWGTTEYHNLEISGTAGGYITSDLLSFKCILDGNAFLQSAETDDEQSVNLDGSAPKLRDFHVARQRQEAEFLFDALPILKSFWLRDTIASLRHRKKSSITLANLRRHGRKTSAKPGDVKSKIRQLARQGYFVEALGLAKAHLPKKTG